MKASKPATIDEYLAAVPPEQRAALEKLRKTIRAIVPKAEECINYGVSAFQIDGKSVAGFGVSAKHCSYYPMSGAVVNALADDLKGYETSKGSIRFTAEKPLPAALVRKLVKARLAEIEGDSPTDAAVTAWMKKLNHPMKKELESLRKLILEVSPLIQEGIKWNAPSFRTSEWFATVNVHGNDTLRLILHTGAKVKAAKGVKIADPKGLLEWLAKDRALVTFSGAKDFNAKKAALKAILKQWIKLL